MDEVGIVPDEPVPYWGWGDLPDQYRRRWDGDGGESTEPNTDPALVGTTPTRTVVTTRRHGAKTCVRSRVPTQALPPVRSR